MILEVPQIIYKKISRISPSQFYAIKSCSYRSLLAESMERKPLLPVSAAASYGTVLHKMLEFIAMGKIKTEAAFEIAFSEQITEMENKLKANGWGIMTPLQLHVRDFTMKKILIRKNLVSVGKTHSRIGLKGNRPEQWLISKDNIVGGLVDLIIEKDGEVEIVDFKTGSVVNRFEGSDGDERIKEEYLDQLKLYAYLYFEKKSRFPDRLSLVDVTGQKYNVNFSQEECIVIFADAKRMLDEINTSVDTGAFSPNPTEDNCKYCLYRPGCKYYLDTLALGQEIADVSGILSEVIQSRNKSVNLLLIVEGHHVSISGLPSSVYEEFLSNKDKRINIFNLKKRSTKYSFTVQGITMIYEPPQQ
jgi:CRISPR/Cas system-associated exonuclease Cas4 (RecB family)